MDKLISSQTKIQPSPGLILAFNPTGLRQVSQNALQAKKMTADFSKAERKALRELSALTYESEAHQMLEELDAKFQSWRNGEIDSSELLQAIHDFHQHQSRELWSRYHSLKEPEIVARALAMGLLKAPVPEELRTKLAPLAEFFQKAHQVK